MKRMKKLAGLVLVAGMVMMSLNSCEKDSKSSSNNGVKKYLEVGNADFVAAAFPEASDNGPEITNIAGNSSVIEGGSNPISVYSDDNVDKVLVGVESVGGYYEVSSNLKSVAEYYLISIVLSTDIPQEEFIIIIAIVDNEGLISEIYELPVEIVEAGTGKLQVSLSWDQENDVDLHLVEPDEEEIYYSYDYSSNGGFLDLDSNPGCSIDGVNNENITYADDEETVTVEAGEYIVRVDFYSDCSVTERTNYIVTARLDGNLITGTSITNPYYGYFEAGTSDQGSSGSGVEVMRFSISSSQLKSTYVKKYRAIQFPNERTFITSSDKKNSAK